MTTLTRQRISLDFDFKIINICDINKSFAMAEVAIAYAGRNRNKSAISKEAFEKALPSLKNCPVVGRYDETEDRFGGHDVKVITDDNGSVDIVNATTPFGVVPESAAQYWKDVTEEDGTIRPYLFTTIILWKRQYGYEYLSKKKRIGQSMEISFSSYTLDQDGYCIIDDFQFEALCLIDCEPCFESASVQLFNQKDEFNYKTQFQDMLKEFKLITKEQFAKADFSINNLKKEGGKPFLDKDTINKILKEFNIKANEIAFNITDDLTEEEFRNKLKEIKNKNQIVVKAENFALTYKEKRQALENALDSVYIKNDKGDTISCINYWVQDFDDIYVYVERYTWTDNNQEETKGRFTYSFNNENNEAVITSEFEEMFVTWLTKEERDQIEAERAKFEKMQLDFEDYKTSHSFENSEVEKLKEFKTEAEKEQRERAESEIFEKFDKELSDNEEYKTLKANCSKMEIDELNDKCFSILGKKLAKFSAKEPKKSSVRMPVSEVEKEESFSYEDLYEKYLDK